MIKCELSHTPVAGMISTTCKCKTCRAYVEGRTAGEHAMQYIVDEAEELKRKVKTLEAQLYEQTRLAEVATEERLAAREEMIKQHEKAEEWRHAAEARDTSRRSAESKASALAKKCRELQASRDEADRLCDEYRERNERLQELTESIVLSTLVDLKQRMEAKIADAVGN